MESERGIAARFGITLLNLFAPGLGLLRLGQLRRALLLYAVTVGTLIAFIAMLAPTQNISFGFYATAVVTLLIASLAALLTSIWLTWRYSRMVIDPRLVASRWYSIAAAIVFVFAVNWLLTGIWHNIYHNFYIPSEAMEPSLMKQDRFLASMRKPEQLHRGEIILVRTSNGTIYVKRLAALPGDRIGLRNGVVFINGSAVQQTPIGVRPVNYPYFETKKARLFLERFPGETHVHIIQDLGPSDIDNYPEVTVAPGHIFTLGDNRDDSADSRVSADEGGVQQVPLKDVIGRALFFYWPMRKMGQAVWSGS